MDKRTATIAGLTGWVAFVVGGFFGRTTNTQEPPKSDLVDITNTAYSPQVTDGLAQNALDPHMAKICDGILSKYDAFLAASDKDRPAAFKAVEDAVAGMGDEYGVNMEKEVRALRIKAFEYGRSGDGDDLLQIVNSKFPDDKWDVKSITQSELEGILEARQLDEALTGKNVGEKYYTWQDKMAVDRAAAPLGITLDSTR